VRVTTNDLSFPQQSLEAGAVGRYGMSRSGLPRKGRPMLVTTASQPNQQCGTHHRIAAMVALSATALMATFLLPNATQARILKSADIRCGLTVGPHWEYSRKGRHSAGNQYKISATDYPCKKVLFYVGQIIRDNTLAGPDGKKAEGGPKGRAWTCLIYNIGGGPKAWMVGCSGPEGDSVDGNGTPAFAFVPDIHV
jgi:hypothetical protein